VAVSTIDADRTAVGVGRDHGVHAIGLAGSAEILDRFARAVTSELHVGYYDRTTRESIMNRDEAILFSGGAAGAEAEFGACAERHRIEEVNFTFEGHTIVRHRGVRVLNHEELQSGDVSLAYVSRLMHRRFADAPTIRKVLQTLWYQVNNGQEIYVIGTILEDGTVRGGTGWGAEFAKLCNKPLHVFDQEKNSWFTWSGEEWEQRTSANGPIITHAHFTGTGTRKMQANGSRAVEDLFRRSFGA
jgi:hypothetical protein